MGRMKKLGKNDTLRHYKQQQKIRLALTELKTDNERIWNIWINCRNTETKLPFVDYYPFRNHD